MMNKKEILKKVGGILSELNEQFEYLSQSPENLNDLELELFAANANFLSDHLSILVKLNEKARTAAPSAPPADNVGNDTRIVDEKPVNTPVEEEVDKADFSHSEPLEIDKEDEEPILSPEKEELASDWKFELEKEPDITFDFEEKRPDALFDRPLTEEELRVIDEKTRLKTVAKEEGDYIDFEEETDEVIEEVLNEDQDESDEDIFVKEVVISEKTIAVPSEPITQESSIPTINDILSKNVSQETVASQFTSRQSKDLKGMISLNDKLLFVRDLFNGYSLAYSEALELLNRFDSFEAADNFLKQNYASKNNWGAKQDVADKFYGILNQRFTK